MKYFTRTPDALLDLWMAALTGAEFKVVMYILRRTTGFGKSADAVSYTQICRGIITKDGRRLDYGTGLSRSQAAKALNALSDGDGHTAVAGSGGRPFGLLKRKHTSRPGPGGKGVNIYSINLQTMQAGPFGIASSKRAASGDRPAATLKPRDFAMYWNKIVRQAPVVLDDLHDGPAVEEAMADAKFVNGFTAICSRASQIHEMRGSNADWLTFRWLFRTDDAGFLNWWKLLSGELEFMENGTLR